METFTARELDVLTRMVTGATNAEIGADLGIALDTVRQHVSVILLKVGARSREEAVHFAFKRRIISARKFYPDAPKNAS